MLGTIKLGTTELGTSGSPSSTYVFGQVQANIIFTTSVSVFDPEVYGEPVYSDVMFDTDVYGEMEYAVLDSLYPTYNQYAQASAQIISSIRFAFEQAQADILAISRIYGQAQANTLVTAKIFAQAQSSINAVSKVFAQTQSDIIATYRIFGQAQADVATNYRVFSQAQGDIKSISTVFAQAQADTLATLKTYAQTQASIKLTLIGTAQAQADIDTTIYVFAQAQTTILSTLFIRQSFAQALATLSATASRVAQVQSDIVTHYIFTSQAQADILVTTNNVAQSQANIKVITNIFAQSSADIRAITNVWAQAQSNIKVTTNIFAQANANIKIILSIFAQSQSNIKVTSTSYAQAQAAILHAYIGLAQSQANILRIRAENAQANAAILRIEPKFAQAQAYIFRLHYNSFAQAISTIRVFGVHGYAHTYALIDSYIKVQSGNASAYINKSAGYGQAAAQIVLFKSWAQAQAQIKQLRIEAIGQARALIVNRKKQGQAQASIKRSSYAYGQACVFITKSRGQGQANARMIRFGAQGFGQSRALINFLAYGQASADILVINNNSFAQSTVWVKAKQISFTQAQAHIVIPKLRGFGQVNTQIISPILRIYGQSMATIFATGNKFGLTQAHIIGNTGYGQSLGLIDGMIIEDLLSNAHTYALVPGTFTTNIDFATYGSDITDADPAFSGTFPADGTWNTTYYGGPNGWAYFTIVENLIVRVDTLTPPYVSADYIPDTIIGIFTGVSGPGAWESVGGNDDFPYGQYGFSIYQSLLTVSLSAGTYLLQVGMYDYSVVDQSFTPLHISVYHPQGYGQAQAEILQPVPRMYGQAQAFIGWARFAQAQAQIIRNKNAFAQVVAKIYRDLPLGQAQAQIIPPLQGYGQAQAKINSFNTVKTGLAVARIRLDYVTVWNGFTYVETWNSSNKYQDLILAEFPTAYYQLNEPLFPGGAGQPGQPYTDSNMLYKDTVWDNLGLYDLNRQWGGSSYGPYGGATVGTYASNPLILTSPLDFTPYFSLPTGIPGTEGDTGILSKDEGHNGHSYLHRQSKSAPISTYSNFAVEFWYNSLQPTTYGGDDDIILVGNVSKNDSGAITISYQGGVGIKTYFGWGGGVYLGPSSGPFVAGVWYHVVYVNYYGENRLYINGSLVDAVYQNLAYINNTVFIHPNPVTGYVFLLDEVVFYDWILNADTIMSHYLSGLNISVGFGNANAYILVPTVTGQAQATVFNPWAKAQAVALIITNKHRVAQAQAYIKGYINAQAQALITRAKGAVGQSQAIVGKSYKVAGQAEALITSTRPVGQARAVIAGTKYFISYNGYQLPGYAQEESSDSIMGIKTFGSPYRDMSFSEYTGLENKSLSLRMLVMGENYLDCKNQIELAGTLVRSNRSGFAPLYVQYTDRHFEALTKSIKTSANTRNIYTSEYTLEFETKPWLVSNIETTVFGTSTIITTGRTLDNGGWTPASLRISGTNVTISGYTAAGDYTGYISISGVVTNFTIDTETYETSDNKVILNSNYQIYVGPGVTYFTVTGATDCVITWRNRWYL